MHEESYGHFGRPFQLALDPVVESEIRGALAERDIQIAELQQAIVDLANQVEAPAAHRQPAVLQDRVAALESQVVEQDRAIRHILTIVIQWIEAETGAREAI